MFQHRWHLAAITQRSFLGETDMFIQGIGIVCNRGRGIEAVRRAVSSAWQPPSGQDGAYRISDEFLRDPRLHKDMRRADRFSRMGAVAALDAMEDAGTAHPHERQATGVIVATGFGPHATTFKFLDDILSYKERDVSPTTFSHSVHNAAASYIALVLGLRAPTITLTSFTYAFYEALAVAAAWLAEKKVSHVLVGAIDESSAVLEHVVSHGRTPAAGGRIDPFTCRVNPQAVPGEGAVFFLLSHQKSENTYAALTPCTPGSAEHISDAAFVLAADGLLADETGYKNFLEKPSLGFGHLFGTMPAQLAFAAAVAALLCRDPRPTVHNDFVYGSSVGVSSDAYTCVGLGCDATTRQVAVTR